MTRPLVAVIEPAASLALVSVETVKDELGIPVDDVSQDDRLARYIAQTSAQIHAFCHRIFPAQKYRNTFRSRYYHRHTHLILSERPIISILGISSDGAAVDGIEDRIDPETGIVPMFGGACETIVDFEAGYLEIPLDIQAAALRVITLQQSLRGRDPYLKVREGPTYGREEFWVGNMPMLDGGLPSDVAQMLQPYVRQVFA